MLSYFEIVSPKMFLPAREWYVNILSGRLNEDNLKIDE